MGLFLVGRAAYILDSRVVTGSFDQHAMQILAFLVAMIFSFLLTMALVLMIFRAKEIHLREVARRDALTGLRNRYALEEISHREVKLARRHEAALSLVAIDLDHFKRINNRFGHAGGDHVLKETANRLQAQIRESDLLFRVGGEEFLVLLPFTDLEEALIVAERIRASLDGAALTKIEADEIRVTGSLGVAELNFPSEDWERALLRADQALYRAKELGRNKVEGSLLDDSL